MTDDELKAIEADVAKDAVMLGGTCPECLGQKHVPELIAEVRRLRGEMRTARRELAVWWEDTADHPLEVYAKAALDVLDEALELDADRQPALPGADAPRSDKRGANQPPLDVRPERDRPE